MEKIFVVEDDMVLNKELCKLIEMNGYESDTSNDWENIIGIILKSNADLILLDVNLPGFDGYYVCREIRKKSQVPIIIVTSRASEMDELMSMNLGADDYINKPYNSMILMARISSVLRRSGKKEKNTMYKDLLVNMSKSEVSIDNKSLELTKNELRILLTLINKSEEIVSRDELMEALWQTDEFVDDNTLTVNINRLRKKLQKIGAGEYIKTKRGQGYILII